MSHKAELWINGKWVEGERQTELRNPYNGEVLATIGYASPKQAVMAIEAAAEAFQSFRQMPAHKRSSILYQAADLLERRTAEAARIVSLEAAKPIQAARAEIARTVQTYLFAAEAARSIRGETVPMDAAPRGEGRMAFMTREPVGVVTAITPFNFPFNLAAHKVGPAIAAGNTIVLKPAEQTPLSALFLAELFEEAGLPDGVLNIIPGEGKELGETLATHPDVAFVTFTGSPAVGRQIRSIAGFRKVTLELGGNAPLLIDRGFTETELEQIADEAATGAFAYNGQVCISVQRILVHEQHAEAFAGMLAERAAALQAGDPLDEQTAITPLINQSAADRLKGWLQTAVSRGAELLCGGEFDGSLMTPAVLRGVPEDAELSCEEAFGPVVLVSSFADWQTAIQQANRSKYGLQAGVFTKDVEKAFAAARELQAGGVMINDIPTFRLDHMPYGGLKDSGSGREGVRYAVEDMTEPKLISFRSGLYRS
ncbi:aldehyde dehydrogenase family protein [Paenibacillus pasadenensis]|uniref:aldehyde dehydrogenase family protein n=1 Tax=Paenibacillus pasadenensis TaxID=217090 RepID=UPI00203CE2D7|nr:aldehyde dehydrogenase family protein [Paenibacillus pasadenensis]MCM3749022.1 aldehyde dehydrogenase family protein [Paenibacillus pasadenensis]